MPGFSSLTSDDVPMIEKYVVTAISSVHHDD